MVVRVLLIHAPGDRANEIRAGIEGGGAVVVDEMMCPVAATDAMTALTPDLVVCGQDMSSRTSHRSLQEIAEAMGALVVLADEGASLPGGGGDTPINTIDDEEPLLRGPLDSGEGAFMLQSALCFARRTSGAA